MGIYDRDYYQEGELRPLKPWDNKSMVTLLIIANAILFLGGFLFSDSVDPQTNMDQLSSFLSLRPQNLWSPIYWWRLISYGFVHSGVNHIFFNMLSLYFLGRSVEDRLGKWEFFRFYMLSLLLCGVLWCGLHAGNGEILLGASGATTAVTMLFVFCFPQANLLLMMAIPVKAWMVGILIIVLNLFTPNMEGQGNRVAYDVHLVGAAFAAVYYFAGLNFGFLGSFIADLQTKWRGRQRGIKVYSPSRGAGGRTARDDQESDRILEKIHREGQDSLTDKERKFMEQYSRQVRQRRGE